MVKCDVCGSNSMLPDKFGNIVLCRVCSMKILAPTWRNKVYGSYEEVEKQRLKIVESSKSKGFPEHVVEGLSSYINSFKKDGVIESFDGGVGQSLVVYEDKIVIDANKSLEYSDINKAFQNILKGKRGGTGQFEVTPEAVGKIATDVILGTLTGGKGSLVKKAVKSVGKSVATNVLSNKDVSKIFPDVYDLDITDKYINISDIANFRVVKPVGSERYGFVFFDLYQEAHVKNVFVFGEQRVDSLSNVLDKLSQLHQKHNDQREDNSQQNINNQVSQKTTSVNAYDELIKLKELLDLGILTEEEFQMKKKELLNL